jgi:hypothetical protein
MARGNDGNYFQHSVETALAKHLLEIGKGKLHFNSTHGMAPFEPCENSKRGIKRTYLDSALAKAGQPAISNESPIISAYRRVKASRGRYPNSGAIFAALTERPNLTGGITEVAPARYSYLEEFWAGTGVTIAQDSWRNQLGTGGIHRCPEGLSRPWLFSMDPMKYSVAAYADDDKIYQEDRGRIITTLTEFISSKQPGAGCIFVYAMHKNNQPAFWTFSGDIASATGMTPTYLWMPHLGGNRNLAVILHQGVTAPIAWPPTGVHVGTN